MNLELGGGPAGNKHPGYVSMDAQDWHGATDIIADISHPWPMEDATVERIYSAHVLERVAWFRLYHVLQECLRVLVPGGEMEHIFPEFGRIVGLYNLACHCVPTDGFIARPDCPVCHGHGRINPLYLKWSLCGQQCGEWDVHRNVIHEQELCEFMRRAGFDVAESGGVEGNPVVCRVVGVKPK